jgi:bifunctional enzyme CysN/CysC
VTLTLADEIDVSAAATSSPGRSATRRRRPVRGHRRLDGRRAHAPGPPYLLKLGARTVAASVTEPKHKVNVNTLEQLAAKRLELNEIGVCNLSLDQAIAVRALYGQQATWAASS